MICTPKVRHFWIHFNIGWFLFILSKRTFAKMRKSLFLLRLAIYLEL